MFTKTIAVGAAAIAFAGQATAFSMPPCWETCFTKHNVTSEGALCEASLSAVVSTCVTEGCAASNSTGAAQQYSGWLASYCDAVSTTANTWTAYSTATETATTYTTLTTCPVTWTSGSTTGTSWTTTMTTVTASMPTGGYGGSWSAPATWTASASSSPMMPTGYSSKYTSTMPTMSMSTGMSKSMSTMSMATGMSKSMPYYNNMNGTMTYSSGAAMPTGTGSYTTSSGPAQYTGGAVAKGASLVVVLGGAAAGLLL